MKKRVAVLLVLLLVFAMCLPMTVSAAVLTITKAQDNGHNTGPTTWPEPELNASARAAVKNLRKDGDFWFASDTAASELILTLEKISTVDAVGIQWYQGGASAIDITATNNRKYTFIIYVSSDNGATWTKAFEGKSDTGMAMETYTFDNAVQNIGHVKIFCNGFTEGTGTTKWAAIREVEVRGTVTGDKPADLDDPDQLPSAPDPTEPAKPTGDIANILLFGGVAVIACAAVVIIRKKILFK